MGDLDGTHPERKKSPWSHYFWNTGAFICIFFMLSLSNCCRKRVMMDFTFSYPHIFLSSMILQLSRSLVLSGSFVDFTMASVKWKICNLSVSESIVKILVGFVILCVLNHAKLDEKGSPKRCSDFHSMQSQFLPSFPLMKINSFPQEVNEDKLGFLGLRIPCFHGYLIMYLIQLQQTESVHEIG